MKKIKTSAKEDTPDYLGHRDRLRKTFCEAGADALNDYELLELLLFHSIPRKDVKSEAKRLIGHFGGINKVLQADIESLCAVEGISDRSALLIALAREIGTKCLEKKALDTEKLGSPELVAEFARAKLAHSRDEILMAVFLNAKNRVCGYDFISEGTTDCAVVYPKKIVRKALEKNACGIILAHNHPSGECEPSNDDISLTRKVKSAAETVDIKVLDHIIVGVSGYYSLVEKKIPF